MRAMRVLGIGLVASLTSGAVLAAPARAAEKPAAKTAAKAVGKVGTVRTVFLPSPGNPLVAIRLYFQLGAVDDPKGKEGLASLTADMIGQGGTKSRTYAEVLDALYPLAAGIRVTGDKESFVFSGTVHRDNREKFADLLAEQVLAPRFAEDDFTRNKQDAIDWVTKALRGTADEDLGKQAMATVMYKGHPYGRPSQGTVTGLQAISLEDVKAFHASHFSRDRLIVGVAGGLGALFLLLRNPALAAIVASLVTERKMEQRGYRRRRR